MFIFIAKILSSNATYMNTQLKFEDWLKDRLAQQLPGQEAHKKMMHPFRYVPKSLPTDAKESAVLLLLLRKEEQLHIVLIERSKDGSPHSGQIAFPGGRKETTDATLYQTALRESAEEIALHTQIQFLGALTPLYIPVSNFNVYPYVAFSESKPELEASDAEVARIILAPLAGLFSRKIIKQVPVKAAPNGIIETKAYEVPEETSFVWGATGMILSELEVLLEEFHIINSKTIP